MPMSFIRCGRRLGWVLQPNNGHLTDSRLGNATTGDGGHGTGGAGSSSGTTGAKG
jgi:hypothetical protein